MKKIELLHFTVAKKMTTARRLTGFEQIIKFVSSNWFAAKSVEQMRVEQSQFEQFTPTPGDHSIFAAAFYLLSDIKNKIVLKKTSDSFVSLRKKQELLKPVFFNHFVVEEPLMPLKIYGTHLVHVHYLTLPYLTYSNQF